MTFEKYIDLYNRHIVTKSELRNKFMDMFSSHDVEKNVKVLPNIIKSLVVQYNLGSDSEQYNPKRWGVFWEAFLDIADFPIKINSKLIEKLKNVLNNKFIVKYSLGEVFEVCYKLPIVVKPLLAAPFSTQYDSALDPGIIIKLIEEVFFYETTVNAEPQEKFKFEKILIKPDYLLDENYYGYRLVIPIKDLEEQCKLYLLG